MHIDLLAAVLWIADFAGSAALLLVLFRNGLARQWPSLVTLLSTNLVVWIALAIIHKHYRWYFYTYWIWTAVVSAQRLWLLADCLRSIPGTGFIPRNTRLILVTTALVMALGAALIALHQDGTARPARVVLDAVLIYNQAVCFASLGFAAASFGIVAMLGLGWDTTGARIASGLGLEFAILAFRSAVFTESLRWLRAAADYAANFSHLFVLLIWLFALMSTRKLSRGRPPSPAPLPPFERRVVQTL